MHLVGGELHSKEVLLVLACRHFLTKTRRYIDRGRHLEKQRKRLRGRGGGRGEGREGERRKPPSPILNPSTSPLKTLFDSSQLCGSINVQDSRTTSFLKTIHGSRSIFLLFPMKVAATHAHSSQGKSPTPGS